MAILAFYILPAEGAGGGCLGGTGLRRGWDAAFCAIGRGSEGEVD